jgi:hypothetical protein
MGGSDKNPYEEKYEGYIGQSEDEEEEKEDWVNQAPAMSPTLMHHQDTLDKQTQTTTNDIYDQMKKDLDKTKKLLAQS